jgi:hypothetical protein
MAINRHIYRHKLHGMVAINNRKVLQTVNWRFMQFNFTGFNAVLYLRDSFVVRDGIKLHTGLEVTTILEGDPRDKLNSVIESIMVQIMGIFSFVAVASCGELRLLSHMTIHDNDIANIEFYSYPLSGDEVIIGTPRAIDENIFTQVWRQWDISPHKGRLNRALTWFAKGLGEEQTVDKFISYWVSIEVLAYILRRKLQFKVRSPGEWEGVKTIFTRLGSSSTFKDVYEARNQLLHGFEEFTPDFFDKIKIYITPTRNVALQCIADVLELPDPTSQKLISLNPRRMLSNITTRTSGNITGVPKDTSELLRNPPELEAQINSLSYKLKESGDIDFNIRLSHTFHSPTKMVFNASAAGLTGHAEAGIEDVHFGNLE